MRVSSRILALTALAAAAPIACGDSSASSATESSGTLDSSGTTGSTSTTPTTSTSDATQSSDTSASSTGEPATPEGARAVVALLETTDLHTTILGYDYFKLTEDPSFGLERTATLIQQARQEFANTFLVDNGDTIQGTVLADFQALVEPIDCADTLAIYKVMNHLEFDVGGIGNHEFNYGLPFLSQVTHTPFEVAGLDLAGMDACAGPAFPQLSSNVFSVSSEATLFPATALLSRTITAVGPDEAPIESTLTIGFVDITPPQILNWDKKWLDGKVYTAGVQEVVPPLVEALRGQGADLVVAIIHGGLDDAEYTPALENQGWYLAQVPGIDAMLMGHSHQVFPNAASTLPQFDLPMVDKTAGSVAGVPAVMANFWGQHLGVMKLGLVHSGDRWTIDAGETIVETRPISTTCMGGLPVACDAEQKWRTGQPCAFAGMCEGQADKAKIYVDAEPSIAPLVAAEHEATIAYVKTPIGTTDFEMTTVFADVGDVGAIQIVNQAQADYVVAYIEANLPEYADLPVLSMSAPFKSGFQGGNDYTDVPAGSIAINNAADLYLYANTAQAVKVTGAELQDWLETAALRFNQIDPAVATPQPLINPAMPGYNFDMITDPRVSYEIDVTQPLPPMGEKASGRIKNLTFEGAPIEPDAEFIVATNNYRASGGGQFPGLDGTKTIYAAPDTNREVLIAYIKKISELTRAANGSARSWRFKQVVTMGPVTFSSAQNALPKAQEAGIAGISLVQQDDGSGKSLSLYAIDLSK
ncbi:2',3'-cyclic-nucleotide 2'-phosphodiesterase / 3'-nucleotidase [Nannocystis exedens]|uniref:2',3'-cyclic-nucleotide 2'-phosphodiesterase / 3'-nucleotidase n=1 Tax=Nannocystis exedens TaxID=54 RepID=A0A1I1WQG9_9BACT|nr:5'-nucleotidase C-terminal domain-containing protein [Nannocystis exedens]PCC67794.1 bifunctional metallophosphatase/5'-nucleotidase [Nannocystis exedens]SFD95350.1 2',3'-cyclic-nucleotide 2'-phosphodiesterase / 3'-nucleotidase [Nannocystis exedens]